MRLAIINHHGGEPAGAEHALMLFIAHLPSDITPVFFILEEGEFTDSVRRQYSDVTVVPISPRVAAATRTRLRPNAIFDAIALAARLADKLRHAHVDAVLTNSMKAHIVGSLAARAARLPCVNFVHDLPDGLARWLIRQASKRFARERLTCSSAVAKNLNLPRTTVVYTPLDTARYRALLPTMEARGALGLPTDELPVMGIIGRVAPWKGQDRFIRIAAQVRRKIDARFVIVGSAAFGGDPAYVRELDRLVELNGLHDRVHFVPRQDDPVIAYSAIDISCNCSTREPFARTTIEAMACGKPVVCFSDHGICEVFGPENGVMGIPVGDEAGFAARLIALCSDPETRAARGAAARHAAERFDIGRLSEVFAETIYRVANQGNRVTGLDPMASSAERVHAEITS
jgi:glycosyltransferase involved in cell wall biosynthesis